MGSPVEPEALRGRPGAEAVGWGGRQLGAALGAALGARAGAAGPPGNCADRKTTGMTSLTNPFLASFTRTVCPLVRKLSGKALPLSPRGTGKPTLSFHPLVGDRQHPFNQSLPY